MEEKRCYGCMKIKHGAPVCEHCGFDEGAANASHQLPCGTILKEQYMIGRVLGQGGFGITYLGWDLYLDIPVAVKEYYPGGAVMRDSTVTLEVASYSGEVGIKFRNNKERFMREAKMLARFSQVPEIVGVKNFFLANNTAYIVMEYVEGINLKQYVADRGGKLSVDETFSILRPVMEALCKVHKAGLVHRDISPDNIMMLPMGGAKLLDFGAVRDVGTPSADKGLTKSTEAILKQGYAPIEQYQSRGSLGPWTDVYALCATVYYCLTGQVPADAPERLLGDDELHIRSLCPELTKEQEAILTHGMELRVENRIASVDELLHELFEKKPEPDPTPDPDPIPDPIPDPTPDPIPDPKPDPQPSNLLKNIVIFILSLTAVGALVTGIVLFFKNSDDGKAFSGECGESVLWIFDSETGTLTVSGTGDMANYGDPNDENVHAKDLSPWYTFRDKISKVVIGDGITSVGTYSFNNCTNLKEIEFGNDVAKINKQAFSNTGIETLRFNESLSEIGIQAFEHCEWLTEVFCPSSVTYIEMGAFKNCSGLMTLEIGQNTTVSNHLFVGGEIPANLTIYGYKDSSAESFATKNNIPFATVGENGVKVLSGECGEEVSWEYDPATGTLTISGQGDMTDYDYIPENDAITSPWFVHHESIKKVIINDGITRIGNWAFAHCENLTETEIPSTVKSVGVCAYNGASIEVLHIPEGVEQIEGDAFSQMYKLREVTIPNTVKYLYGCFWSCPELSSVTVGMQTTFGADFAMNGPGAFSDGGGNQVWNVPENLVMYGYSNTVSEEYAKIYGIPFEAIGEDGWDHMGTCGDNIEWYYDSETRHLILSGEGEMYDYKGSWEENPEDDRPEHPWAEFREEIDVVYIHDGITKIGENAFENCTNLGDLYWSDTLEFIGTQAFLATGIDELVLPNSVKTIEPYAFNHCSNLQYVVLPEELPTLENSVFNMCTNINDFYVGHTTEIPADNGDTPFTSVGSKELRIPSDMTIYGHYGTDAENFANEYSIGFALGKLGHHGDESGQCGDDVYWIFDYNSHTLVLYGTGQTYLYRTNPNEDWAKDYGTSVFAVYAPYQYLANDIFNVIIAPGVQTLNHNLFSDLENLSSINFGEVRETHCTISNCNNITEAYLPETLTHIGEWMFNGCTQLRRVTVMAEDIKYFGEYIFNSIISSITLRFENAINVIWGTEEDIFQSNNNVTIECLRDSDPMRFAEKHGIKYEIIN